MRGSRSARFAHGRAQPKIMGSDTSDTSSDEIGADRVAHDDEIGLGGGLDQAEEARLRKRKP